VKTQIDIYNTDTIKNEIYNNETLKKAERITDQSKPIDSKLTLFTNKLNELNGGKAVEIYKVESIGPVIGKELTRKAIIALVIALLFQLVYITVRFGSQMRYGLAADIALAHDLIIMVGIYSIMSIFNKSVQVDSPFVAALLTVVGYSVMDSIVIFDRIRENLKVHSKESFEEVVNISVNQTMTRSINTLMTVLFPMFALYFFGGATLKSFAFALLVGLTSGAYSSIFIASPMLVMLDNFIKAKDKRQRDARSRELSELEEQRKKAKEEAKTKKM